MTAIEFENISKQYRLGLVSTQTLSHDLRRFWITNILGKENPYLKIGETNDRATKGTSDYVWALRDINFKVEQGDVVGIIGKNGAGKSTLLKLLSRVTGPTTGTIRAHGRIGSLLEVGTGFHGEMTGRENIFMNGAILGMTRQEIQSKLDAIIDFSGCERYIDTPVKRYSSGMVVRLGFAVAAFLEPEILVVDEVLAVGDAEFQKKAIGKMKDVSHNDGRTVLFVSHNMGSVRNLCNRGILLENGMIKRLGRVNDVVDYYMDTYMSEVRGQINFTRRIDSTIPVVFVSGMVEHSEKILFGDDVSFVFNIHANQSVRYCRINATIKTMDDIAIGSISNDEFFAINTDEDKQVRLTLCNPNLAPGLYKASFSLGTGNYITGQTDFDIIEEAFVFEIYPVENSGMAVTQWERVWGAIMLQHRTEIL